MTHPLTWDTVQALIARNDVLSLTILMPTSPSEPLHADQTRLRHLMSRAETHLLERGFVTQSAQHFLAPVQQLTQSDGFWRDRKHSLALFLADGFLRWHFVSEALPETVTLSSHFYIKPVLPLAQRTQPFHILTLTQTHVRLRHYEPCAGVLQPIPLPHGYNVRSNVPDHDDLDAQRHARSFTRGTSAGPMTTHSHGAGDVPQKDKIVHYFRQVSEGVEEALHNSQAPLILAGVAYLQAMYRQVNRYPRISEGTITGNLDAWGESQLIARAQHILEGQCDATVQQALTDYKAMYNTQNVTRSFKDIVRAASAGRIETLFAAQNVERWGLFDAKTERVQSRAQAQAGDEPLVNLATVQTLRHHGRAYVLPRSKVPHGAVMAARLRY